MAALPERWLVVGGSGFLGAQVVLAARAAGAAVTCAARRPELPEAFAHAVGDAETFEVQHVDLELAGASAELVERARPVRVVSCVALARGADCEREPRRAERLNVEVPEELARACAEGGARFVHVSTDLVFDGEPPRAAGYREEDPARPLSIYGRTKLAGEQRALAAYPGALVVRLPLLYGPSGGRGLGASDALLAALARGDTPTLFTDEVRTPLEVREAAGALVELGAGDAAGRLHVAGPRALTRHELGRLALLAAGHDPREIARRVRPASRADFDLTPPRPRDVSLDAGRARALLEAPLSPPERLLRR